MKRNKKTSIIILLIFLPLLFWNNETSKGNILGRNSRIKLMTYNVYGYRMIHRKRTAALIKLIEKSDAHIITLQEAKPWFLRKLLNRPKIKLSYKHSKLVRRYTAKGGLFLLSRFPIIKSYYVNQPGRKNKYMLLAKVIIDNEVVPVVNVHLESPLWSKKLRKRQLQKVFEKIRWYRNAIVMGDFNFGDSSVESSAISRRFSDLWLSLKYNKKGYTWDMKRNKLARKHAYKRETSRRLDRILINHSSWKPVKIKITGKRPIYLPIGKLYPSDHFALIGTVTRI